MIQDMNEVPGCGVVVHRQLYESSLLTSKQIYRKCLNRLYKLEFHGADTNTDTDILARMSVSVSASWNASYTPLQVAGS